MPKIEEQKHGTLTKEDMLDLARLLVKAGYRVRVSREKPSSKSVWKHFVEYEN